MRKYIYQSLVFAGQIAFGTAIITQPATAAMRGEYTIKNDKFGINAYVYGKRTVLEFTDAPFSLVVKDKQGLTVSYERIGERFYRMARQLEKFSATVNGDVVEFDVYKPEQVIVLPPPAPVEVPAQQPPQAVAPPAVAATTSGSAVTAHGQPGSVATQAATTTSPALAAPLLAVAPAVKAAGTKGAEKPPASATTGSREPVVVTEPEPAKQPAQVWEVEAADLSVFAAMKRWTRLTQTQQHKWQLSWEIPVDFPVTITGTYSGNFEDVVGELLEGYSKADYRPKVCVYSNNVVRIVRFLGTGTECD